MAFYILFGSEKKCSVDSLCLNYADQQLDVLAVNHEALLAFHSSVELHEFIECMESL